jgi:hypothetical protein
MLCFSAARRLFVAPGRLGSGIRDSSATAAGSSGDVDRIAWEMLARYRIHDGRAENPLTLRLGRDAENLCHGLACALAIVIEKKEGLFSYGWTAERPAELVLMKCWCRSLAIKKVSCVQHIVPQEFIGTAVLSTTLL